MKYTVQILRAAQKSLAALPDSDRSKIIDAIRALADDPRPPGAVKLSGRPAWRIRVGNYRVIYEIVDQQLEVLVVAIGHRRDIYR
ncbi:MAG: type II toxin-antitoxin system RelE family toxin [Candidatus Sumerlaeaceae bacterium]